MIYQDNDFACKEWLREQRIAENIARFAAVLILCCVVGFVMGALS